jgi:hypothetical protein
MSDLKRVLSDNGHVLSEWASRACDAHRLVDRDPDGLRGARSVARRWFCLSFQFGSGSRIGACGYHRQRTQAPE